MSVRSSAAADMQHKAEELDELVSGWPRSQALELARAAVHESSAILRDAARELVAPPKKVHA